MKSISDFTDVGIDIETAHKLFDSGYYVTNKDSNPVINDSFYGSKIGLGQISIQHFFEWEKTGMVNVPEYTVSSLKEIKSILNQDRHANYRNRMSFRGQNREIFTKRSYPNPILNQNGMERLIIPSYWRRFSNNWNLRFQDPPPYPLLLSSFADELIYYGIPDWETLAIRNFEKYGPHSMFDMEDFPDWDSQEYFRRWHRAKIQGNLGTDLPIIKQHYGISTEGLDVTFNEDIAVFFATYRFQQRKEDGTCYFSPIPKGQHTGVIYSIVYTDPPLLPSSSLITNLSSFPHLYALRTFRQFCALASFNALNINQTVCDLDCIFKLTPDFDMTGVPDPSYLFPNRNEDYFYNTLLQLKELYSQSENDNPFKDIVEYRF